MTRVRRAPYPRNAFDSQCANRRVPFLGITALDPFPDQQQSPAAPARGQVVVRFKSGYPDQFKDLQAWNPAASLFLPIASLSAH